VSRGASRQDHYEVLGVDPKAPDEVVRAAYRALVAKYHPDRNPGDRDAGLKLKRLNAAFAVLGDPEKRRQYDELTSAPEPTEKEASPPPSRAEPTERPKEPPRWKEPPPGSNRAPVPASREKASGGWRFLAWTTGLLLACFVVVETVQYQKPSVEQPAPSTLPQAAATTTAPPAPQVPEVPPQLPGERPPTDGPNYFEPKELSSGGVVAALTSCEDAARKADPNLTTDFISSYCTCITDATRRNFRASSDISKAITTTEQLQKCAAAVRAGAPSPYAFASPRSTADLWKMVTGCFRAFPERDHGGYCDCRTDATLAVLKNPQGQFSLADEQRCRTMDAYWVATKTHLTIRQFKALGGT
jgi:hypothetical protein